MPVDDDLPGELYRRLQQIYVLLDDDDRRSLRALGLTPTQLNLMRLLDAPGEGAQGRTISRLAELLLCTRGNVTRLVQRLVEAGLVRTEPDRADQRLVKVYLTDTGGQLLRVAQAHHGAANRLRFAGMTDEELRQLNELAGALAAQLVKHLGGH